MIKKLELDRSDYKFYQNSESALQLTKKKQNVWEFINKFYRAIDIVSTSRSHQETNVIEQFHCTI